MLAQSPFRGRYAGSTQFAKLRSADHERVERLVAKMERSVRRAFLAFVENVQSQAIMRQVAELIGGNDIEGALRIVDRYVVRMAPVLSRVFQQSAAAETDALEEQIKRVMPVTGISFEPTHPRAAELMRSNQLRFVRQFTDSQRQAVRAALSQGLMDGGGSLDLARDFRAAIGLTRDQVAAVRNYRRLLVEGNAEALQRDIRDRRFDPTVRRAVATGEPLSAKQIDVMVERYRQRYLMYRSEVIARNETGDVVSAARQEALDQMVEDLGIADSQIERVWRTNRDGRERPSHHAMNGQTVQGTKAPFISGAGNRLMRPHDPTAPTSEVIQCRCVQTIRIKRRESSGGV